MEESLLSWLLSAPTAEELTCSCGHVAQDYPALSEHRQAEREEAA